MEYLLGIDIGTSGTKTVLFDRDANPITAKTFEYPLYQEQNGWAEQEPEDWWNAVVQGVQAVLQASGVDAADIKGIGLSGQMHGLVMLDENGEVLRRSIIWCDQRTGEEVEDMNRMLGAEKIIQITANPAVTGFTAAKILWVKKHEPELYAKCAHILLPKDYIRYKLTGEYATEVSDASGMQLMDVAKRTWSDEILEGLGIEKRLLGKMYESQDVTGEVHKEAAALTGLAAGTIVVGGAGDNPAAAIGTGIVSQGKAFTTIGTSAVVYAVSDRMALDPKGRVHTLCASVPGKWTVMSCTQAAGLSLQWLRNHVCTPEMAEATWADGSRYASNSLLSEGKWVKIRVDKTGIYKLSYADLKNMGFSDPSKVSVHGYGGWPLDEDFSKEYIDDVPSTPVWRGSDYLLFYGKGSVKWEYDSSSQTFVHTNNPYSLYGYYFVTDATPTNDMTSVAQASGASTRITTYDDYLLHEQELVSVNQSGREFFGEDFSGARPRTISTFSSIPGITDADGKVTMRFISRINSGSGTASLSINDSELLDITIPSIQTVSSNVRSYTKAIPGTTTALWKGSKSEKNNVVVSYSSSGHTNVRLDYIRMQFVRTLRPYGACTFFRSLTSVGNASRFVISEANSNTLVFDVTDALNVKRVEADLNGSELSFTIPAGRLREFVLVQTNQTFPSPEVVGEVASSNLHGLEQRDMIIISAPSLVQQAERLAVAHREKDGLTVEVVTPEAIYNEFSSGTPDATAYRRLMKMFYDRSSSLGNPPKYLLLFGDGIYDNRGISGEVQGVSRSNMLLTFQSQESLNVYSYATDDYFAFLEDNSGSNFSRDKMCVGVGRFPIRTVTEATQMVDKTISYMENKDSGSWKNNVTFVADDGNNEDSFTTNHMKQADQLAEAIEEMQPGFLVNKVYFDAYKRSSLGTYPDVHNEIEKLLKSGQLLINYTGHGSTTHWADESVWTQTDINNSSYKHLPVWVTATCDFTRFDDVKTSAGESVFLNPTSGGIALFTTTRVVFSGNNANLNKALIDNLFQEGANSRYTLGEAMMYTKRQLNDSNKLNFILIGDPALKFAYPEYKARVTAVNGEAVSDEPFEFKALSRITVEGEILNPSGSFAADFTGVLSSTIFDSQSSITTLGNSSEKFTYLDYPNTIYIGRDSVRNGKFSFTFMVPKDISYSNKKGKLNLYASSETKEAQGSFFDFIVGGTSDTAETDTIGPEIRQIYLNDSSFVSGDKVNTTPYFVAKLWDKSGVNITGSSVGHDMMLTIDSMPSMSYNLNSYYALLPDSENEGLVQFSIPELEPGMHTAEFKVWDILNNSTTYTFTFEVAEGLKPNLIEMYATPNPARDQVEFFLHHNRPESNLKVTVMVYDMTGKFLWSTEKSGSSELFKAYIVTWNLTDNGGRRLRPGVYLYRAAISTNNSKEATKANKLIILAQ